MMIKAIQILILIFFVTVSSGQDLTITIEGNTSFSGSEFMITEAGENLDASSESESSVYVSILSQDYWDKKNNRSRKWRIFVQKSDLSWNNNLILETKRNGNGYHPQNNGNTNIHDGENFLDISNTPTYFFRGKDEIAYIPINFKLGGLSLTMGAQQFETNVILTIYDDW